MLEEIYVPEEDKKKWKWIVKELHNLFIYIVAELNTVLGRCKNGATHREEDWLYPGKISISDTKGFPLHVGPWGCWCEKPRNRKCITFKLLIFVLICKTQYVKICCFVWWMKKPQQTFERKGYLQVRNRFYLGPPQIYTLLRVRYIHY